MASRQDTVARLLHELEGGDRAAADRLFALVYDELRLLARRQRRRWHGDYTLDTTALVHEAYLKLVDQSRAQWRDRNHFFAVAATAMRQIVVDHARRRSSGKRGGGAMLAALDEMHPRVETRLDQILALDQALTRLGEMDDRLARMVELRFFAGLSIEETAGVLRIDPRTVNRDWRTARALLYQALSGTRSA